MLNNRPGFFVLVLVAFTLIVSIGNTNAATSQWQGQTETRDGTLYINNPAHPMQAPQTIKLPELFRVGGETDDDNEMFGRVMDVAVDDLGQTYLLDMQLSEVKVFDQEGLFVRTYGRSGQGPGEYSYPMSLFFLPGGKLGVNNLMPSRVPVRDLATGHAADDLQLPKYHGEKPMFITVMDSWQGINVVGFVRAYVEDGKEVNARVLATFRDGDEELTILNEQIVLLSDNRARHEWCSFHSDWELSANGVVYVAPCYLEYQIYGFNTDGTIRHIIEREYETLKRTNEEIDDIKSADERRFPGSSTVREPSEYHRHIEGIFTLGNGELWVLSGRGVKAADGIGLGQFDVYNPEGQFIKQVILDVDYDERWDTFDIVGNRLYVHKEARAIPATSGTGPGGMGIMIGGGEATSTDDHEAQPYELVCYDLIR